MSGTNLPAEAGAKTAKVAKKSAKRRVKSQPKPVELSPELRREMVREAAYYRAEKRGFQGGDPVSDWLAGEQEVDTALSMGTH